MIHVLIRSRRGNTHAEEGYVKIQKQRLELYAGACPRIHQKLKKARKDSPLVFKGSMALPIS